MAELSGACGATASPQRYKWFVRLSATAIALAVVPAVVVHFSDAHGGVPASVSLAVSFVLWQAAQVFLCLSGREVVMRRLKGVVGLNTLYVLTALAATAAVWGLPRS